MQFRYEVRTTHFHTKLQLFAMIIYSMFSKKHNYWQGPNQDFAKGEGGLKIKIFVTSF